MSMMAVLLLQTAANCPMSDKAFGFCGSNGM